MFKNIMGDNSMKYIFYQLGCMAVWRRNTDGSIPGGRLYTNFSDLDKIQMTEDTSEGQKHI